MRRAFFQLRLLADCIERFQKDIVDENCHSKEPEAREDKTELADGINVKSKLSIPSPLLYLGYD